jgi:hypothetical protein
MDEFTIPISKPANFGVSQQEIADLASKLRMGFHGKKSENQASISGQGQASVMPAASLARVR